MSYDAFKKALVSELEDFYGKDATAITINDMTDDMGRHYDGLVITMRDMRDTVCRGRDAVDIAVLYERHERDSMDIYDCVEAVYRRQETDCCICRQKKL